MRTARTSRDRSRTKQAVGSVLAKVVQDGSAPADNGADGEGRGGNQLREQLRQLLTNEDLPAAARVNAARTLAELEGLIGRHQAAPDRTAIAGLSSLTREDLTAELDRLRTLFGMGLLR